MTRQPLVTVITPTYNHVRYIGACIESVLRQTYPEWEQIVIDDGSTDGTADVIARYQDPRIRSIWQERRGLWRLAETYNRALREARGELIAILEGDDLWTEDKLSILVPALIESSAVLAYGRTALLIGERPTRQTIPYEGFIRRFGRAALANDPVGSATYAMLRADGPTFTFPAAVVIRKEALLSIGGFQHVEGLGLVDYPTFLRLSLLGRFLYHDGIVAYWRRHPESSSWMNLEQMLIGCSGFARSFVKRYGSELALTSQQRRAIEMTWRWRFQWAAVQRGRALLIERRWSEARNRFAQGLNAREPLVFSAAVFGYCASWLHLDIEAVMRASGRPDLRRWGLSPRQVGSAEMRPDR